MERFLKVCRLRRVKILVLFHLFVVNAAADCQKPQATVAFVLSKAALLLNNFPEGLQVILQCGHGYNRISGSGATVCSDGQWSKPDLICEENDCGLPKPEPNMRFNISEGTRFRAKVTVLCDKGYKLIGSKSRQCYATGWIGNPKCRIVTCDKPTHVTNGRSLWSSEDRPKYGETIQYLCNKGYTLIGKEKLVCTETGKYDSQPPECKAPAVPVTSASPIIAFTVTEASAGSSAATPTAPTDSTTTPSAATVVSYSARGDLHVRKTEGEGAVPSVLSTASLEDLNKEIVDTNKHTESIAIVIFGILCILLVFAIGACTMFRLRRKGSYDTREDLKPEISHFHNL